MTAKLEPICRAYQVGRCGGSVVAGKCKTGGVEKKHVCGVILKLEPLVLCEGLHAAKDCPWFTGF